MAAISFQGSLGCTGLNHVLDNATEGLQDVVPGFAEQVHKATQVCKLVGRRDTRTKLLERCYNSALGRHFRPQINKFGGRFIWGAGARWRLASLSCWQCGALCSGAGT